MFLVYLFVRHNPREVCYMEEKKFHKTRKYIQPVAAGLIQGVAFVVFLSTSAVTRSPGGWKLSLRRSGRVQGHDKRHTLCLECVSYFWVKCRVVW